MVDWRPIQTYKGGTALFWCRDDWLDGYAVYGEIDQLDGDPEPRIWDDGDRGYAVLSDVTHWAECTPPGKTALH